MKYSSSFAHFLCEIKCPLLISFNGKIYEERALNINLLWAASLGGVISTISLSVRDIPEKISRYL